MVAPAPGDVLLGMPERAGRFCRREGLEDPLEQALRLAERYFPALSSAQIDLIHDPESGEEWLSVHLGVLQGLSQDDFLDRWDAYSDAWVDTVPDAAEGRIRVSFDRA